MVASTQTQCLETNTFIEKDVDATAVEIKSASSVLYSIEADNTNNTAKTYLKIWDLASGAPPSVGTTEPDFVFPIQAGVIQAIVINQGVGITMGTGIYIACVTTGGKTGTTSPTNAVRVTVKTS